MARAAASADAELCARLRSGDDEAFDQQYGKAAGEAAELREKIHSLPEEGPQITVLGDEEAADVSARRATRRARPA